MAPGDPVKSALGNKDNGGEAGQATEKLASERSYFEMAEKMGLHLPTFYFSFSTKASPDTIYKFLKKPQRETVERFVSMYGNWPQISDYYHQISKMQFSTYQVKADSTTFEPSKIINENVVGLFTKYKDEDIQLAISAIQANAQTTSNYAPVLSEVNKLDALYKDMKAKQTPSANYIPAFYWYGMHNQFHRWMFGDKKWFSSVEEPGKGAGFIRLDFGFSYLDKRPVWSKMKDALPWTLTLNMISLFLAYIIALPLGVWSARKKGTIGDRIVTFLLFLLNSLPVFWIATMMITFLTTEEYGMDWFPTYGLGEVDDSMSVMDVFLERFYHIILPVICLTYGAWAYLSRQMRGGVLTVLRQDYIRTARAKGLDEGTVVWKHAFRNSLIPIITIFASIFPASIAGSFIIENIFSIPGMGKLSFEGLVARDYPMVFTVMMLSAVLTMVGNLFADIMYAVVDPRISYDK
jgi:peptide/nickel transport system permease protein